MSNERYYQILQAPRVTEKATLMQAKSNQYVFEVARHATKTEIKNAVEKIFNVNVKKVTVSNMKSRAKQVGRIRGMTQAWKKAYITLASGQTIDVAGTKA